MRRGGDRRQHNRNKIHLHIERLLGGKHAAVTPVLDVRQGPVAKLVGKATRLERRASRAQNDVSGTHSVAAALVAVDLARALCSRVSIRTYQGSE